MRQFGRRICNDTMKRKELSRRRKQSLCAEIGPDDGIDPHDLFRQVGRKRRGRKTLQLCGQVAEALDYAFAAVCNDDVLRRVARPEQDVKGVACASGRRTLQKRRRSCFPRPSHPCSGRATLPPDAAADSRRRQRPHDDAWATCSLDTYGQRKWHTASCSVTGHPCRRNGAMFRLCRAIPLLWAIVRAAGVEYGLCYVCDGPILGVA
jgi:hypothetical protein